MVTGDDCPELDLSLLGCAKKSAQYRELHRRFAGPKPPQPSETWRDGDLVYFVFDLIPDDPAALIPSLALFVVSDSEKQLLLVRQITPYQGTSEAQISDLYRKDSL